MVKGHELLSEGEKCAMFNESKSFLDLFEHYTDLDSE